MGNFTKVIRWKVVLYWAFVTLAGCTFTNDSRSPNFKQTAIFEKYVDQGIELYLLPLHDNDPQMITLVDKNERYELSPDGLYLIVYFGESLRLIDLITFQESILDNNLVWPTIFIENIDHKYVSWSPNGNKLAILNGGPSWMDKSLVSTTLKVFDIQQKTLDFVWDNGTWINDLAWSEDSKLLSFSESNIPCFYIENCEEENMVIWSIITLTHLEASKWESISSIQLDPPVKNEYWRQNSICQLSLSPGNEFISYQSPCPLGELLPDRNLFITTVHPPHQILNIPQERYAAYSKDFDIHWLNVANQFVIIFTGSVIETGQINFLDTYEKELTTTILLNREKIEGLDVRFDSMPINFSPDNQYAVGDLRNDNILLMQFNDSTTASILLPLSSISLKGLWLPQGYLTQSEDSIVFIHPNSGEWEVVRDNLPDGFVLSGWQIIENEE